jgi:hypothetical protein
MNDVPKSWRSLFDDAMRETDLNRRLLLCQKARQGMQERLIELSACNGSTLEHPEQSQIEEALRKLWSVEQTIRRSLG